MIGHNLVAYCRSNSCNTGYSESKKTDKKITNKQINFCPDCKSALSWEPLGRRMRQVNSDKRKKNKL